MQFSKQYGVLFWQGEMSERIVIARTVTEATAFLYRCREGASQIAEKRSCHKASFFREINYLQFFFKVSRHSVSSVGIRVLIVPL